MLFIPGALAVHDLNLFEMDKNATNNELWTNAGTLGANINSSVTSINVCQTATGTGTPVQRIPATNDTIIIDGEKMTIVTNASGSFGGNCSGTKRTYTVSRAAGTTTAASHSGGEQIGVLTPAPFVGSDGNDWDQVAAHTGDAGHPCSTLGAVACNFLTDPPGVTVFNQGSSDIADVNTWSYADMSAPDADEILNAFAAKYNKSIGGTNHQILYFGADRYATNGSKDFGFWFFKNPVTASGGSFSGGNHEIGDILILGTFTQGGAATTIRVFKWVGTGGNQSPGTLDGPDATFGDCVPGSTGDNGCATVNDTTIPSPWQFVAKGETSTNSYEMPSGALLEGGIDLTASGLSGCFSSFMAETRSSPSLTAQLKDFTIGGFEACQSSVSTTPADSTGTALTDTNNNQLPDTQIGTGSDGVDVTDNASMTVGGLDTWTGTVAFHICGPIASGTCDTGGVAAGTKNVSNSTLTATSDSVNLTSIGRYCWRGDFTPSAASLAAGLKAASDHSASECFEVLPVTPDLATTAWSNGDATGSAQTTTVSFGSPLYDKANLLGTANEPGDNGGNATYPSINATNGVAADGSLSFTLLGPGDCTTVAAGTGSNPETGVTVTGDGDYFSSGFTTDLPGVFHWAASYTGSTSGNTTSTDHNTDCLDTSEDVTVQQLQPTMDTAQKFVPNDSATVNVDGGAGALDGYLVFKLYVNNATCTDPADYTSDHIALSATDTGSGTTLSDTDSSANTTAYNTDGDTFSWVVEFHSNNSAHLDVTSPCTNETSSIAIDNGVTQPTP